MNVNLFFIHFGGRDSFPHEHTHTVENPRSHQMTLDYFYGQSGELFSYFRVPKALFQDHRFRQLSTDARTLYGILLDRIIVPYFRKCNIKLVDLKATDLQNFYNKQLEWVKANSVIHYHASINKQSVHSPVGENAGENRP